MRRNYDAKIASLIWQAQEASSEAKLQGEYSERMRLYHKKDVCIIFALDLISKSRESAFRYSVQRGKDQNGVDSYIVYFSAKIYDEKLKKTERLQVSFHNFSPELKRYISKSNGTRWDRKCSRDAAEMIASAYGV